ncbi:MFS transporter [Micromonospora sp. CPCC 206060]|uniref:MFS transporter n=1 Tax=Micromonospora sp. CPCC 206060 TaxID=3122406 RepID=UPI002FF3711E
MLAGGLADVSSRAPFLLYSVAALVLLVAAVVLRETARPANKATGASPPPAAVAGATREIARIYALAATVTVIFYMAPTQWPFWLTTFHTSAAMTGTVIAGSTLTGTVGALTFPRLRRHLSPPLITALSIAVMGVGWVIAGTASVLPQLFAGMLIGGIGVGIVVPNLDLRLTEIAPAARRGRVLGGLVMAIFLGQFLSPLAVQPVIDAFGIAATFTSSGVVLLLSAASAATGRPVAIRVRMATGRLSGGHAVTAV